MKELEFRMSAEHSAPSLRESASLRNQDLLQPFTVGEDIAGFLVDFECACEKAGGRAVLTRCAWAPVLHSPIFGQIRHPVDYLAPRDSSLHAASNKPTLKSVSGPRRILRRLKILKRGLS
ncbi:hypothetical protein HPB48_026680 [Haemaphysalis longicornis]|uniref:Uncharacterized protein n=1 Tax=Haemaphysalis longicornis TaxID=44386 RepID=A0A9J6HCX3_HAELO|nr:hypothetical protein HPB48_026680 [Haemaphysalis longicornis]